MMDVGASTGTSVTLVRLAALLYRGHDQSLGLDPTPCGPPLLRIQPTGEPEEKKISVVPQT
jgi:hypothetical protein